MKRQKNLNKYLQNQFTCIKHMLLIVGWGQEPRRQEGYRRWGKKGQEMGEKFKKASFYYLLLLTSNQRNERNIS